MAFNCRDCGEKLRDLRQAKRHYREEHGGEIETPEEHLPDDDSEQLDFDGEEPDTDGHDPEYLVEDRDPPDTHYASLNRFSEDDGEDDDE